MPTCLFRGDFIFPFFHIFGKTIAMYGLLIVIGTALGVIIACFRKNHYSLGREDIFFSSIYAGIGIVVGSKLLFILLSLPSIIENWGQIFSSVESFTTFLSGGFVFYGGLIGAFLGILYYTKRYKIDTFAVCDVLIPSIPLIHAIGRIGCFCAGCCYGKPSEKFGVFFNNSPVAPHNIALFPVQLLESGINLLIFVFLIIYSSKPRKKCSVLGAYLITYGVARFFLEFLRFDYVRGIFLGFSTSQWISLILIPIGFIMIFRKNKAKTLAE
ncbi:MAG: prolipoprotein diacylglyceryl transferase [Oscillospiraceae bacterium]